MMKSNKKVLIAVGLTFIYGVFSYFCMSFLWNNDYLISLNDITANNVWLKLLTDSIGNFLFVLLIFGFMLIRGRSLSEVGFTSNSRFLSVSLLVVYLGLFLLHGDFSVKGIYRAFFFLIVVAFVEEFIFRGFLFTIIDREYGFWKAVIISGLLFGAMHGLLPTIVANGSFMDLLANISDNLLGQGVFGTLIFAYAYKKSGTLFVPILIHAILDYL